VTVLCIQHTTAKPLTDSNVGELSAGCGFLLCSPSASCCCATAARRSSTDVVSVSTKSPYKLFTKKSGTIKVQLVFFPVSLPQMNSPLCAPRLTDDHHLQTHKTPSSKS
ncbi:unnamed protein product, partial [Sphacelaria rigidula]